MTVFKGYLRGALSQKYVIILYLVIFLALGILMTGTMDETNTDSYTSEKLTMTVTDRDHSALSEGLTDYLAKTQDLVSVEDDREVLTEELYYGNIQYVLVIPEGFGEHFAESGDDSGDGSGRENAYELQGTGRPGSTQMRYASELADGWLSGVKLYLQAGYSPEEAVNRMKSMEKTGGMTVMQEDVRSMSPVAGTLRFLPYVVIALSCYIIGFIMLDYQNPDIRNRLAVSAVSRGKRLFQMLLAILVIGVLFFVISILMTALMNPGTILQEPNRGWYLLNIGVIVIVGLSTGFFVVNVTRTGNGVNGLANAIALGMSFLCGVFIPDTMLSASVKKIARFLPVYWYEQNNSILGTHSALSTDMVSRLVSGYEIQLVFAAALLAVSAAVGRFRERG